MHTGSRTPHVVIIEHAPSIRSLFQELLREEHYRATLLDECPASADEIVRLRPDVIIHDYAPTSAEMDIASLQMLCTDPSTCHLPLILCSAALDVQEVADRLGGRQVTVVRKPFLLDELLRVIETRSPRSAAPPTRQPRPETDASA